MTKIGHIAWRELRSYFTGWMAYALLAGWLVISGLVFSILVTSYYTSQMFGQGSFSLPGLYSNMVVIMLFCAPLLTMRLVAEERNLGTVEMLFTSPVSEWQVALGKFLGGWAFIGVMLLLTVHFPFFATRYGSIDTGPIWGSYISLTCMGAGFVAYGLFCSSLTDSQVVAGFLTFSGLILSWMLNWVGQVSPDNALAAFVGQWSIFTHFQRMMEGAVDTRDLIFFISLALLFLFATVRVLESRKWR